jgi:5-methylcytosine-specific restriction endonuclease McrA
VQVPEPSDQIKFLANLQRLLAEGSFTATYKYALLSALADLCVEHGDDTGEPWTVSLFALSEKLVEYYWRHAVPYTTAGHSDLLKQSTGKQVRVINLVSEAHSQHGPSLANMMRNAAEWKRLVRSVVPTLKAQPLWRLQLVGKENLDFLYGRSETNHIELRQGVSYCLRQFFPLVQDLVKAAWLRDVRRLNGEHLGETTDLQDFLFGAERSALAIARPILMDLQRGQCFYCSAGLQEATAEVDHFIPWARYSADLAHNLVLADRRCNGKKRDRIAHFDHLARWVGRNRQYGDELAGALNGRVVCDLASAESVARWSYAQTEASSGLTWFSGDMLLPLAEGWRDCLV